MIEDVVTFGVGCGVGTALQAWWFGPPDTPIDLGVYVGVLIAFIVWRAHARSRP